MDNIITELNSIIGTLPRMGVSENEPQDTPQGIARVDPMERPIWEIDKDIINPYADVPPIQTWCMMGNRPALPKEGIVTFSAKPKRGKSLSIYALTIPLLSGLDFDSVHPTDCPNMILVFDMEIGKTTLTNRAKRQMNAIGYNGQRFLVCNIKGMSKEKCVSMINNKIRQYNPPIVVIDQAGKLVDNVNDPTECNAITNMLDKISVGRAVWVVMHENKGKEDTNMRGHLGTYLSQAAVESYSVDRNKGVFIITPREARETDVEGADPVRFTLNDNGEISDPKARIKENMEKAAAGWRKDFRLLFGDDEELRHKDIVGRIMESQGLEKRAAETKIMKAAECGALEKVKPQDRQSPYRISREAGAFDDIDNIDQ